MSRRERPGRSPVGLRYTTDPIVSSDVIGDPASCVFDASLTRAAGRMVKVFGWYDNECCYTARLVDLTRLVATSRMAMLEIRIHGRGVRVS